MSFIATVLPIQAAFSCHVSSVWNNFTAFIFHDTAIFEEKIWPYLFPHSIQVMLFGWGQECCVRNAVIFSVLHLTGPLMSGLHYWWWLI